MHVSLALKGTGKLCTVILLYACGGGGGGDSSGLPETKASLSFENSDEVVGIVNNVRSLMVANIDSSELTTVNSTLLNNHKLSIRSLANDAILFLTETDKFFEDRSLSGTISDTFPCDYGGTEEISASYSGSSENPYDINMTINVRECGLDPSYEVTGTITLTTEGSLENYDKMKITFNADYKFKNGNNVKYRDFSMVFDKTIDNSDIMTINGKVSGTANGVDELYGFENFMMKITNIYPSEEEYINGNMFIDFCGIYGWINVKTIIPLTYPGTYCPNEGNVEISSNGDTIATYIYADNSIDIYFNEELVTSYTDCTDLENNAVCSTVDSANDNVNIQEVLQ